MIIDFFQCPFHEYEEFYDESGNIEERNHWCNHTENNSAICVLQAPGFEDGDCNFLQEVDNVNVKVSGY